MNKFSLHHRRNANNFIVQDVKISNGCTT